MMNNNESNCWDELQVARLLEGLTDSEQEEYDQLAALRPPEEQESLSKVVASLDVAWSNMHSEKLPEHLRRTIRERANQELAAKPTVELAKLLPERAAAKGFGYALPWLLAAACLLIAVFSWAMNRPTQQADPAQLRAELIASNTGVVQANWLPGTTPVINAAGDVVWSSQRQQGFMRIRGLPVNKPTVEQYQLWIFDKNQSDKTPVDGGVFDITSTGETIVPIDAKLRVQEPFMFAVTIEKSGGVVVSSRERLPLLAKIK